MRHPACIEPISTVYPHNGVTLWDRIRVSSKKDRRAFLLGTAIQVHAPATTANLISFCHVGSCRNSWDRPATPDARRLGEVLPWFR